MIYFKQNSVKMERFTFFTGGCGNNDLKRVKRLISEGVDINCANNPWGTTLLMLVMGNGSLEVVSILGNNIVHFKTDL